ncbi:hypothetical protein CBOM_07457 [Ceraceosorus bombacis]|uniref:Uncharacterized protein n=1 Tax=Ceraceosorus bombacis TaxID=401625 RepID=A0A0P1BD21_9BASI|nr:hypothetical protein CBOM_07457 [Ceraceosorus bombacis]
MRMHACPPKPEPCAVASVANLDRNGVALSRIQADVDPLRLPALNALLPHVSLRSPSPLPLLLLQPFASPIYSFIR